MHNAMAGHFFTYLYLPLKSHLPSAFNLGSGEVTNTMKSKWFKFAGASILAAGMAFVYAETPAQPQAQHKSATREEWAQRRFDRMATYLNLTDAQNTQAQGFMQQARESSKALVPQLKQN